MDSYEIINYISNSVKKTPARIFIQGELDKINFTGMDYFGNNEFGILFCENNDFETLYNANKQFIKKYKVEIDRRNSAIPLADLTKYKARIEPGAIIRDMVEIGDNCVIMMGSVINIGAVIGEKTMI
ncbi:MAG: 2,3,4,5-tetrahydropyridine-2,6-dicarboxylate N-acetyltransferase, partial [Ignavibacteriaceae bacterium]|nr:2,3,4,5-tetrahydropyridine-2,6-dicarboxylate N-acetyltransferase [Ignavibacteriaceae bacterium]